MWLDKSDDWSVCCLAVLTFNKVSLVLFFFISLFICCFVTKPVWNLRQNLYLCLTDFGGKQDTVKFVQDTSKFWYKPDISRDQGKYWSWTAERWYALVGLFSVNMMILTLLYVLAPWAEQPLQCWRTKSRARSSSETVIHFVGRMD